MERSAFDIVWYSMFNVNGNIFFNVNVRDKYVTNIYVLLI